ncbi:MAG: hypothetical protein QXY18_05745 [Nitrososphaerota archaeon]
MAIEKLEKLQIAEMSSKREVLRKEIDELLNRLEGFDNRLKYLLFKMVSGEKSDRWHLYEDKKGYWYLAYYDYISGKRVRKIKYLRKNKEIIEILLKIEKLIKEHNRLG